MNEELRKSLSDLIDETLVELEELKKSRYASSEIEIKGPGEGIAGKPSNGDLHAKAEDKKDDEDEEEKKEKEEAMKAEGKNREADPNGGNHKPASEEAMKAEGKNREADPNGGCHKPASEEAMKAEDKKKDEDDDDDDEKKEKELADKLAAMHKVEVKKSREEMQTLMKSFVDERVKPLEDKLSTILNMINKIAEQPVAPKGRTANAVPLRKSLDEGTEMLSKSDVADKLFELKKSGTKVDSLDITRAEMGHDLQKIIEKYKIS